MSLDHIMNTRLQFFVLQVVFLITHQFHYADQKRSHYLFRVRPNISLNQTRRQLPDEAINVRLSMTLTCSLNSFLNSLPSNTSDFIASRSRSVRSMLSVIKQPLWYITK